MEQIKLNYVIEMDFTYFQVVIRRPEINSNTKQAVSYGPWGGNGGIIFDDGAYTGVREALLTSQRAIVSIQICYDLNEKATWGEKMEEVEEQDWTRCLKHSSKQPCLPRIAQGAC